MEGARFKSFLTLAAAEEAFAAGPPAVQHATKATAAAASRQIPDAVRYSNAIAIDAACSGNPGPMEYRGVYIPTGQELFHFGPVHGTNNIGEFLAIVHGMAYVMQQGWQGFTLYSDSRNAINWVTQGVCKTRLARTPATEQLYALIARAETWLRNHPAATRPPLRKWDTDHWGEIPADFGRK